MFLQGKYEDDLKKWATVTAPAGKPIWATARPLLTIELYLEADPGEIGRPAGEYKVYEVAL